MSATAGAALGAGAIGGPDPGTNGAATNGAATPQNGASDWTSGWEEADRGYVQNKGWKGPRDLYNSYREYEKFRGVPQEKLLAFPEETDTEGRSKLFSRLGWPEKPDHYELPEFNGTGYDLGKDFRAWAHENRLTRAQAKAIGEKFDGLINGISKQQQEAWEQDEQIAERNLRMKWAGEYDANRAAIDRAGRALGWSDEELIGLRKAVGSEKAQELFARIGRSLREDGFVDGDRASGSNAYGSTPAAAEAKLSELRGNMEFMTKFNRGDAAAVAEFRRTAELAAQGRAPGGPPR